MILVDTNVLARSLQKAHPHHQPAIDSMAYVRAAFNETLVTNPQSLIELYATCTRTLNGLGLTPDQALLQIQYIKSDYIVLPETPTIFAHWETLVGKYKLTNRRVFDTRHVAFMLAHNIPRILTFNDQDFHSFTEIQTLNPFDLLNIPRI